MSEKIGPDHYRFEDRIGPEGVTIHCFRYVVVGETPCCFYIIREGLSHYAGKDFTKVSAHIKKQRKRVLKSSWRRFAYPDLKDAMRSYKARKRWQLSHAAIAESRAAAAHAEATRLVDSDVLSIESFRDGHLCEGGEYIKGLNWSDC